MNTKENLTYNKILIVNFGGLGDVLLSTLALRALKNNFPKTQISILVVQHVYEIVKSLSYIDHIFIFHLRYSPVNFLKNFYTLLDLRRRHFDLLINMRTIVSQRSASKLKFLLNIINPKIKAGRDTDGRAKFFDIKIPETLIGQKYEMDYDIEMVKALGVEVKDRVIDFEIDTESVKKIDKVLEKEGIAKDAILISIHPGGVPCHRWPIENFVQVINEIAQKISCKFVITGQKDEIRLANRLKKITHTEIINFAGKLNLKELIAFIKRCNLFVTNDTGPMHIAAILKTPLIAIFGPGDITRYDPRNIFDKAIVLYKKIECSPCEKIRCRDIKCLKMISPKEVIDAVFYFLNNRYLL